MDNEPNYCFDTVSGSVDCALSVALMERAPVYDPTLYDLVEAAFKWTLAILTTIAYSI